MAANPICIALDTPDLERARDLARRLSGEAGFLKIGMEFFYAHGARGYEQVAAQGLLMKANAKDLGPRGLASLSGVDVDAALFEIDPKAEDAQRIEAVLAEIGSAAQLAVEAIAEVVAGGKDDGAWPFGYDQRQSRPANLLRTACEVANRRVFDAVIAPND